MPLIICYSRHLQMFHRNVCQFFYLFGILLFRILADCLLQNKLISLLTNGEIAIIPSHHNDSGLFPILLGSKCQLGRSCKLFSRKLLHQQVRNFPEVHKFFREAACIKTNIPQVGREPVSVFFIGMPLPLYPQMTGIEFITLRRSGYRICLSYIRFLIGHYRFTATIFILVYSDYRPIIYPSHRIQMNHASVSSFILKMNEPGFSCVGIYPATLMRPVDICLSLCHYDLRFVRAVNVLRAKY